MVGSHRSGARMGWGRSLAADHLSESQSGQLRRADAVAVAVDARRAHARAAGGDEPLRTDVLSSSLSPVHARILQRERAASLCEPRVVVRTADPALVPAGDYGV